jgi:CheY-like chemotaxis protein
VAALSAATESTFDVVLMDLQMPVMDGYIATRTIRQELGMHALPIIAMTANAMAGDREKVINAGMWDHIAKPLNIGEMFGTIAKWIKPSGLVTVDVTEGNPFFGTGGTASEEIPTMGGLPALPGIDIRAGMATAMDREPLYTRMLVKFRDTQSSFAAQFAAARADPDPLAATRAAHTLKGGAGNIGAKSLQAAAGDLEHACKAGKPAEAIEALLQRVLAELAIVMPGLENVGAGEAAASGSKAPAMSEDELQAALARLKALLADSNPDAGELLGELLAQFEGTPLAAQLKPVAIAVEGFDFDAALEKFNAI